MSDILKRIKGGGYYAKLTLLIGALIASPILVTLFYPEETRYIPAFLLPACVTVAAGMALCFIKSDKRALDEWQSPLQKGSLPVMFAWCAAAVLGAFPFVIAKRLKYIHALFESVSGWTTTGLTLINVAETPHIFLFYRAFMQYCGGAGFMLMILMLVQGGQAVNMYSAEGHSDRLAPNIKKTAQTVFQLYNTFFAAGTILYILFGMAPFDAVCHTMSALSTAGFTSRAGGIGGYDNVWIEGVTVLLMLIGASNFAVLLTLVKRKFRKTLRVSEIRFMLALVALFSVFSAFSLMAKNGLGVFTAFRQAIFGVVTTLSTTGYSTSDYYLWPPFALGLLFIVMIIGGGAGSTAGGIKLSRAYLLMRSIGEYLKGRVSPARKVNAPSFYRAQGKTPIDTALISDTCVFIMLYLLIVVTGSLLITLTEGCSLFDAAFEFTSAIGTVGVSNGISSVNANTGTLLVEMVGMLFGRLEAPIVFVALYSGARAARRRFMLANVKKN
jgi:trk system potassium uptake protein TrkH